VLSGPITGPIINPPFFRRPAQIQTRAYECCFGSLFFTFFFFLQIQETEELHGKDCAAAAPPPPVRPLSRQGNSAGLQDPPHREGSARGDSAVPFRKLDRNPSLLTSTDSVRLFVPRDLFFAVSDGVPPPVDLYTCLLQLPHRETGSSARIGRAGARESGPRTRFRLRNSWSRPEGTTFLPSRLASSGLGTRKLAFG
jgi:hypothetical protein